MAKKGFLPDDLEAAVRATRGLSKTWHLSEGKLEGDANGHYYELKFVYPSDVIGPRFEDSPFGTRIVAEARFTNDEIICRGSLKDLASPVDSLADVRWLPDRIAELEAENERLLEWADLAATERAFGMLNRRIEQLESALREIADPSQPGPKCIHSNVAPDCASCWVGHFWRVARAALEDSA